jgi:tRNA G10  N-methylase Trm11
MIAEDLAMELGRQFVRAGERVLDPFCGTGRTLLAAAELGADCVGVDINPLATLLTRAKSCNPRIDILKRFLQSIPDRFRDEMKEPIWDLEFGRKVKWFPKKSRLELSALINWINASSLANDELHLIAAILSATAREVSFCRQDGWKLHRIPQNARKRFSPVPVEVFKRRLHATLRDLKKSNQLSGSLLVITGDARKLSHTLGTARKHKRFDLIITSPPYGDSRTTVQYGAMSGLSLGVLKHLHRLKLDVIGGGEIDRRCLGGAPLKEQRSYPLALRSRYWHGGIKNPSGKLVQRFLADIEMSCRGISKVLRQGGRAVFVVARRSVGSWRLNLDHFIIDIFRRWDLTLEGICIREISGKMVPLSINKRGHATKKAEVSSQVATMRQEYVLAFRKI